MQYPIAIYLKDEAYQVIVPDIPELHTQGTDMSDAVANARNVVIHHLYQLLEQDSKLPQPSSVSSHLNNPKFAGCTWAIVGIEMSRIMGETVETTIHLPTRLFKQITRTFPDKSLDAVVIAALKQYLNQDASQIPDKNLDSV